MLMPKIAAKALREAAAKFDLTPSELFECAVYNFPDKHLGVPEQLADMEDVPVPADAEAALRAMAPDFGLTAERACMLLEYAKAGKGERLWKDTKRT
jgi:hypothetical protein